MHNREYKEITSNIGLYNLPKELEKEYESWKSDDGIVLLRHSFLEELLKEYGVPDFASKPLWQALNEIEENKDLLEFSRFLVSAIIGTRWQNEGIDYDVMEPNCMARGRDYYSLLLLLACVEPSMERIKRRRVPEKFYKDIPYRPMREQFQTLINDRDPRVRDFSWDLNFYTCSIFQMDHFLFIPCKLGEPLRVYKNTRGSKTMAFYKGGYSFRRDGQLNGASDIWDEEASFVSIYRNDDTSWFGTYINPAGFAVREPVQLSKENWELVLSEGETLLAVHIPSGPGYTPERLKNSMKLALDFYDNYFPELYIKGFRSESWLYDPRLAFELENKDSNILRTQRQLYIYPIQSDGTMLQYELFNNKHGEEMPKETSLQRAAAAWLEKGGHFSTMAMFVLRDDVKDIGSDPYQKEDDRAAFRELIKKSMAKKE